jgi:outer membrane protein assembly factor BamA
VLTLFHFINELHRYHLGGPNSLRGFAHCGTGPRAYRPPVPVTAQMSSSSAPQYLNMTDSLGGDLKATAFAALSVPVPVPILASSKMRAFVFANAGALHCLQGTGAGAGHRGDSTSNGVSAAGNVLQAVRASVGGGISVAVGDIGRLEATYSVPLLKAPQDQTKGFQIGIGMSIN